MFLRDLQMGTTVLVSAGARSLPGTTPAGSSEAPQITPDGHYVAFHSTAVFSVPGATNTSDIYVHDVSGSTTVLASGYAPVAVGASRTAGLAVSFGHAISTNGLFVTYEATRGSFATRTGGPFMIGPCIGAILRYNVASGLTDTLSSNAAVPIGAPEDARNAVMTPDGGVVAFVGNAPT